MPLHESSNDEPGSTGGVVKLIRDILDSPRMTRNARTLLRQMLWSFVLPVLLGIVVVCVCATVLMVAHAGSMPTTAGALVTGTGAGAAAHGVGKKLRSRKKQGRRPRNAVSRRSEDGNAQLPSPRTDQDSIREGQQ